MNRAQLKVLPKVRFFQHACGCRNFLDPEWAVERSYSKCAFHKSESGKSGIAHHEEMGAIKDGIVAHEVYVDELVDPLDEMDVSIGATKGSRCLEIGCGVGSYIPMLRCAGYEYEGIEPDHEIALLTNASFEAKVFCGLYEEFQSNHLFDLIFCAHAFEHMEHAPDMMAKAFSQLRNGGRLLLIIPNDDDPVNPDHLWFFNEASLRSVLMKIGFTDIRMAVRQRVKHEKFIYCACVK